MKTVSIKLFRFDELDHEAKLEVIGNRRLSLYDTDADYRFIVDDFKEQFRKLFYASNIQVEYDITGSQNSGASITCDFNIDKLLKCDNWRRLHGSFKAVRHYIDAGWLSIEGASINVERWNMGGCERNSCKLTCHQYDVRASREVKLEVEQLEALLTTHIRSMCAKIYRELNTYRDHMSSQEYLTQALTDDEVTHYTASGNEIPQHILQDIV